MRRLRKTCTMPVLFSPHGGIGLKRLTAVLSLLVVFALPLHFHGPAATAQLDRECGCLHGSRTLADVVSGTPEHRPLFVVASVLIGQDRVLGFSPVISHLTRAPPALVA